MNVIGRLCGLMRRLLCRHDYEKTGFREAMDHGVRYSVRTYRCRKCGKTVSADGRHDPYAGT